MSGGLLLKSLDRFYVDHWVISRGGIIYISRIALSDHSLLPMHIQLSTPEALRRGCRILDKSICKKMIGIWAGFDSQDPTQSLASCLILSSEASCTHVLAERKRLRVHKKGLHEALGSIQTLMQHHLEDAFFERVGAFCQRGATTIARNQSLDYQRR